MAPLGPSTLAPYLRLWQSKYDTGPSQLPLVLLLLVSVTGALWLAGSGGLVYLDDTWPLALPSASQECSAVVDNAFQQVQLLEQGATLHKGGMCMRFAASFPSKGGVGCSCPCDPDALEHTALTLTLLPTEGWPSQLQRKLTAVSKLVKQWVRRTPRPKTTKRWQREEATWPTNHSLSLHTFCCVPAQEYARLVQEDVEQWQRRWPSTLTVEFDRVGCAVTDDEGHVALTLRLTPASIDLLNELTVEMQQRLGQQHPHPHTPPAAHDAPSLLLATLPPHMPCQRLVDEINARWAPGRWHTPVLLSAAPRCDTCALTAAFHLDGSTAIPAPPPRIPSSPPDYMAHVDSIPLVGFSSLSHDVPPSSAAAQHHEPLRRRFSANP